MRIKRSAVLGVIVLMFLSGCASIRQAFHFVPEKDTSSVESKLVGTWYCSRQNSCNDMEITLEIQQDGDTAYLYRNMVSESGIGSSDLTGTAPIEVDDYLYADFTYGQYSITEDGYLMEYFSRNDRWNLYTKDGFTDEALNGRYAQQ